MKFLPLILFSVSVFALDPVTPENWESLKEKEQRRRPMGLPQVGTVDNRTPEQRKLDLLQAQQGIISATGLPFQNSYYGPSPAETDGSFVNPPQNGSALAPPVKKGPDLDPGAYKTYEEYLKASIDNGSTPRWAAFLWNRHQQKLRGIEEAPAYGPNSGALTCFAQGDGSVECNGEIYVKKKSVNTSELGKNISNQAKAKKKSSASKQ